MLTFVIRRLGYSAVVLLLTSIVVFWGVTVSGDPLSQVRQIPRVSQQTIDNIIERKHLDEPLVTQYWLWVKDATTNDFGTTLIGDQPIWPDIKRVMGNTLQLVIAAEVLAVIIALSIGVLSAVRQYSFFDYVSTTLSFLGFSTPVFWLALILQGLVTNIYLSTGTRVFFTQG